MPKNVVICCDGTANEFTRDRTNVVKLFQALVKDPQIQVCYYHPGVGTMAPPGFVTRIGALAAEIAGLAFGYGIKDDLCDAYIFICRNFDPEDKLYLFGFSRGAYTVRALASLIRMYGLVPRDNDRLALYAIRMMWAIHKLQKEARENESAQEDIDEYFRLSKEFKETYGRECKPHFVGVWDTVSSVGWFASPMALPYTASNPDIAIGRHAVAIDEHRAFFRTNLWRPSADPLEAGPKDLKQIWFPGVHCDIGGGYKEAQSGLSKIAFKWMVEEAHHAGLKVHDEIVELILGKMGQGYACPDANGEMHESLRGWWFVAEFVPKPHWEGWGWVWRPNLFRRRTWPAAPVVHEAAWERGNGAYSACLPSDATKFIDANADPGGTYV